MRTGDATLTKNLLVRKMPVVTTVVSVQKRKAFPLWFLNKILFLHALCIMIIISCFKSRVCFGCYCEVVCRRTFNRLKCQIYRGQPTSNKCFFFHFLSLIGRSCFGRAKIAFLVYFIGRLQDIFISDAPPPELRNCNHQKLCNGARWV